MKWTTSGVLAKLPDVAHYRPRKTKKLTLVQSRREGEFESSWRATRAELGSLESGRRSCIAGSHVALKLALVKSKHIQLPSFWN
jgi:hypothetical protein